MSFLHAASSSGVTVATSAAVKRHARERRRLERERLRLRRALERHFARRHGTLLDAINRLAGDPVEQEQQAGLVDHRHGGNRLAALLDVEKRWRGREVGIPDVVVHDLEVPQVLAGVRVGRDDARAEEIVAGAIAAVLIDRGRAERHVDDAALDVDGDEAPDVDARAILPAVARPRVVELLARLRNRSERPHQLAGVDVPGAHIAQRPPRRVLLVAAAGDDEVLVDGRRRAQADGPGHALRISGVFMSMLPLSPKVSVGMTGLGIERVEPAVTGGKDRSAAASARLRASTRRRASRDCPPAPETPRPLCPWSGRAPRPGHRAS